MHCGASLVTVGVVCDLMCSAQRKVDELDVCELKACSCTMTMVQLHAFNSQFRSLFTDSFVYIMKFELRAIALLF